MKINVFNKCILPEHPPNILNEGTHFLGVCLLTQSVAPTTKGVPVSTAVIGAPCIDGCYGEA